MRIALVGNARSACGLGPLIDRHDMVVRFNLTPYYGWTGYRTDALVVQNFGRPAAELASGMTALSSAALRRRPQIRFVHHPDTLADARASGAEGIADHSKDLAAKIGGVSLPASAWFGCKRALAAFGAAPASYPSSGAVVLHHLLQQFPEATFRLFGFTHKGWPGHPWDAENAWMKSLLNLRHVRWPFAR